MFSQIQLSDNSTATTKTNRRLGALLLTGLLGFRHKRKHGGVMIGHFVSLLR